MEGILKKMQETVNKYAIVLSQVLKVDVEIVDNRLNRIAGTGMFRQKINTNMSNEGYVYRTVIETGVRQIIKNPGRHELCNKCPKKNNCDETFEMSTPIKIGDKVIGVIGFVCFNEAQKEYIMGNYNVYLEFLEQISELIASKALQVKEKLEALAFIDLLNNIIDKIEEGVIILDEDYKINKINFIATKILKLKKQDYYKKNVILEPTGNYMFDQKEYELKIDDKTYNVVGKEYTINLNNGVLNKIFIFHDVNLLKEKFLSLTNSNENMGLDKILGESEKIIDLKNKVKKIALSSSTVLIIGESGTGKELFARAIHEESYRAKGPFIALNCAAIPDTLLESELFGYVKGAFTGADPKGKIGKIELANKGTLFLDEIGDMPLYLQAKLLRVLEQREIVKLGSNTSIPIDVRIIAATNKKLDKMIENKTFREDLYYRLNVIPLEIPPLRERKEDIKLLTMFFIDKFSKLFDKTILGVEENVWEYFIRYNWPGNVRELQNTIEYIINMIENYGTINVKILPSKLTQKTQLECDLNFNLEEMEKEYIKKALEIYGVDGEAKKIVAKELGIGIATLYRKIKKYNLIRY